MVLASALIQSESTFVDIPLEMLLAELVVGAIEHPLQNRPDALDAISTCHPIDKHLRTVVDLGMLPLLRDTVVNRRTATSLNRCGSAGRRSRSERCRPAGRSRNGRNHPFPCTGGQESRRTGRPSAREASGAPPGTPWPPSHSKNGRTSRKAKS